jgi:excisionase family DNA binding protein
MSLEHSPTKLAYGIAEAVKATNVGRSFLYEEIRVGRLKSFKVGNRTLIAVEDLIAWIDSYKRVESCQRRSKSTPLAGVKMHHSM